MRRRTLLTEVLVMASMLSAGLGAAGAATVTLQQGAGGYAGCSTRTIEGTKPARDVKDDGVFRLRGSRYALHVKFDLPGDLAGKPLVRARLGVFVPPARKASFFTEVFCHEVLTPGRQPVWDEATDYDNGRRPGAVDSVELFAPGHAAWPDFPFLALADVVKEEAGSQPGTQPAAPADGRWIEFNVTPLAEKWLKDASANNGVILVPTDPPDRDKASTWEIDIPGAGFPADPAQRPRLILEMAPLEQDVLVGVTDGLTRICDRSTRYAYRGGYQTECRLSMAANEWEGFQLVVYPLLSDLKNLGFSWTDLKGDNGKTIPAADVECFQEDVYRLRRNWMTSGLMFAGKLYDVPDPLRRLLGPAERALAEEAGLSARRQVNSPFYFRVRTRPDTAAGTYKSAITVTRENGKPVTVSLEVKVWPYAVPQQWNFHTMGQFIWGTCSRWHGTDWNQQLQRQYYDFLLDHRFSPTEQYGRILSPRQDTDYCLKRGMNTVYLSGNFSGADAEIEQLKKDCQEVRRLSALDCALVYVGDETDKWDEMRRRADLVHAHLPGALVMIGGSLPREELIGYVDIYDPEIDGESKFYALYEDKAHLIGEAQQRGEEFYWYVCAMPQHPYPNVQADNPLVASRVLFWMTYKYGVTGFEYYCYNIWEQNFRPDPATRWPKGPWKADGWSQGWATNGDGMLFYPGPTTSLRFEAMRDGIEDWESLLLLRDCVEACRNRKQPSRYKALIDKAERMLKVSDEVVADLSHYTFSPQRLLEERQALGDLIGQFMEVVPKTEKWDPGAMTLEKAAQVRIARQTALRRKMLRQRHLAACEALKVQPLPQEAWDALWPKRVLFEQTFEGEGDWDGTIVTDNVPAGGKRALAGATTNKSYARWTRTGIYFDHARAATTTWVKFKYFLSKQTPVKVMVFDLTQGDNYSWDIRDPVVGKWTEVTLKVTGQFRRNDGSANAVAAGDAMDDVFIGAGKPGDADLQLIVDDVQLVGLD